MTPTARPPAPPRPAIEIDPSTEHEDVETFDEPEGWELPTAVVITGIHLSPWDGFVFALRLWFAGIAATLVVAPILAALFVGLILLARYASSAAGL